MPETNAIPDVDTIARAVKALVADVAGQAPESIDATTPLEAVGIDSLLIVEVVVGLHKRFGVQVPPSEFRADIRTVGEVCRVLAEYVHARLSAGETAAAPGSLAYGS
jgi:acyl carrier protein